MRVLRLQLDHQATQGGDASATVEAHHDAEFQAHVERLAAKLAHGARKGSAAIDGDDCAVLEAALEAYVRG